MIFEPLIRTDDEYSDVIHCLGQTIEADRERAKKLHADGLGKFARPFEEQAARLEKLAEDIETRLEKAEAA